DFSWKALSPSIIGTGEYRWHPCGEAAPAWTAGPVCLDGRSSAPDMHHASRWLQELRLPDMVARFFLLNRLADELNHVVIAAAALHHAVQIMIALGKQA